MIARKRIYKKNLTWKKSLKIRTWDIKMTTHLRQKNSSMIHIHLVDNYRKPKKHSQNYICIVEKMKNHARKKQNIYAKFH